MGGEADRISGSADRVATRLFRGAESFSGATAGSTFAIMGDGRSIDSRHCRTGASGARGSAASLANADRETSGVHPREPLARGSPVAEDAANWDSVAADTRTGCRRRSLGGALRSALAAFGSAQRQSAPLHNAQFI